MTLFIIYIVGALLFALSLGIWGDVDSDDYFGAWGVALVWPAVAFVVVIFAVMAAPFFVGRKIRECFQ